jgi:RND family efflux transporter MFP subunit
LSEISTDARGALSVNTPPDLARLTIDRSGAARARPRRRWGLWTTIAVIAVAAAAGVWWRANAPVAVETAAVSTAYPSAAFATLNATGYVVAQRKASVASKATGRLEWLGVAEGSRVRKDDVIARLESRDVSAQREQAAANVKVAAANVEQARAELRDAEQNLQRSNELATKSFISAAALDQAVARADKSRAALKSAEASLGVAQANLKAADVAVDQTLIRAPFDGVVLTKSANVGDNITPFSNALDTKGAVVTMADMETLEVEADVAESQLARIRVEQPAEIQLDALPGERFAGVVSRMVPTVDRAKATILVKVRFAQLDPRVLPDMSAKVTFLERTPSASDRRSVTVVPKAAVVERDGAQNVFVVTDGVARAVRVQAGREINDMVEVSGVEPGVRVVVKPLDRPLDGARVRVDAK